MDTEQTDRNVVVAGGGVAGLETALALRHLAPQQVSVTLLAPDEAFVYRPLATAEPFKLDQVTRYDLDELAGEQGIKRVPDRLVSVDVDRRVAVGATGDEYPYDDLVVALGVERRFAFPEYVMTFRDERDTDAYAKVLEELEAGRIRRIAFMLPGGISWPFPIYELALLTGAFAAQHNLSDVELSLVTTATTPLAMFGSDAAKAMADLLEERNVTVYAGYEAHPLEENRLRLAPNGPMLEVDQMIAGPALYGRPVKGLPADNRGFLEIDTHGRVTGAPHVYAAGDITTFPAKQGGIAARQADAVAQTIAAEAGADVTPVPWRPVLQGKLLTGSAPQFVRRDLGLRKDASLLADHALWWPPTKVAGRYLAQVLGTIDADASEALRERQEGVVDVEVELPVSTETRAPDAG